MKHPGPDHPISVAPHPARIAVTFSGEVIAQSDRALELREADYPPVAYVPRQDVDMEKLIPSDHSTHCPYKGDASYFSIEVAGKRSENAIWCYADPYPAVAQIKGYLAFYGDRVDAIKESTR